MAQVVVSKINKVFDNGFHAVKDAEFIAEDKEFVVLVGPSGCGKTTLLRLISGLEEITTGEIKIGEKVVNNVAPKDRDIAMVFQNYALYPHMTVYDNMAFALKLRKEPKEVINKKVMDAAKLLGIESMLERKPKQLSGGQRQRVALGRAIVRKPSVFLFDEPLSNLDAKLRVQMRAEIIKLHKTLETTMIYVTHDQVEAMTMADKIVVMKDGVIQQIDSPLNLYNDPVNLFVAGFIGSPAINQLEGKLIENEGRIFFSDGDVTLRIDDERKESLKNHINKEVVLGVRPEDLYDSDYDDLAESPEKIVAHCEIVEPMGNEFVVFLSTKHAKLTARFDPKKMPKVDEDIKITIDMKKVRMFDKESELALF
ncbi:MAG: sn-glycerol-3-phosphate ABC transporter ATP-binding protein UgpC [Candidatus Cloacimonadales bacterium]